MEEMNIPIFRAKKIASDEYVTGFLYQDIIEYVKSDELKQDEYKRALDKESWYIMDNLSNTDMINKSTLAIHFPNTLDSQGNKIFASLREDGKGGDITLTKDGKVLYERVHLCFKDGGLGSIDLNIVQMLSKKYNGVLDIKVIGIKE